MGELQAPAAAAPQEAAVRFDRRLISVVFWCFLVSGGTSLVLEGTLTRLLRFVLGNTTLAITTVLCAFMAGLALGSYVSGRLCDRGGRLLRTYGLLEGAVGVFCLLLPAAIEALEPAYRWMYGQLQDWPVALSLARFLLCGLLLLVPTTFMGATLPVLTRWASLRLGQVGRSVAGLYAINSAGAATGALLCGFLLLPGLGVTWTLRLACAANIAICLLMLVLDRTWDTSIAEPAGDTRDKFEAADTDAATPAWRNSLLLAYGLSGAAALVYEVAWTRGMSLVVGSSVYAFSLMLTAFILGLAIGSAIMTRLIDRIRNPVYWFAVVELGIGLSAMLTLPVIGQLPITIVGVVVRLGGSFAVLQAVEFLLMMLVMMVPTTLMGAAFPLVCRAAAGPSRGVGRSVGSVYAVNTVGAIIGTFVASFVLIPQLGTQNAILVAVAANVLIGAAVVLAYPGTGWSRRAVTGLAAVLFGAVAFHRIQPWDPSIMASGAYLYAPRFALGSSDADDIRDRMRQTTVLFHKEDMATAVTVRKYPGGLRTLAVGGKVDASNREDIGTQVLLAHAPLLLHPDPHSALVIGLASGMTLGSAACYGLERLDCVEISPAVVEASHFFDRENRNVLSDPRVRLIIGDGRNHLALTRDRYDVIISEPSNPWIAGVGDLFTREFFEVCRERLRPAGLACVWLHAYQMEEPLFRSVVRTFHETFGHMVIVESVPLMDYLLIGSVQPIAVPYATLAGRFRMPDVAADLLRANIREPLDFLRRIVMSTAVAQYAKGGVLHTDDNALLEFAAPRQLNRSNMEVPIAQGLYAYTSADLSFLAVDAAQPERLRGLQGALEPLFKAQVLAVQAVALYRHGRHDEAFAAVSEVARLDPAGPEVLIAEAKGILRGAMNLKEQDHAEKARRDAAALAPNLAAVLEARATTFTGAQRWGQAVEELRYAAFFRPDDLTVVDNLAWLLATCPDAEVRNGTEALSRAGWCVQSTGSRQPRFVKTLAAAYAETDHFVEAARLAQDALSLARQYEQATLADDIEAQLAVYRQGKPYRLPEK